MGANRISMQETMLKKLEFEDIKFPVILGYSSISHQKARYFKGVAVSKYGTLLPEWTYEEVEAEKIVDHNYLKLAYSFCIATGYRKVQPKELV